MISNKNMVLNFKQSWILGAVILGLLIISILGLSDKQILAQKGPQPVWPTYGLEINNTPGNSSQQNPKIANNIVVWEDARNGYLNLYAQKIGENGEPLWNKDGIPLAPSSKNQNYHDLIDDGEGGVIVVWQDYRNDNSDIYAQKIDFSGKVVWSSGGVEVCKAPGGQFAPELASDGDGGAIIVWHDYRSGTGEDIYAQRIDKNGRVVWATNGVIICNAPGTQWYPKIVSDGQGGAIIVWADAREGSTNYNIFGQRIDYAGKTLWEENGVSICSAPRNQDHPALLAVTGGVIVAWNDNRNNNTDIYAQKINLEGKSLWQTEGIPICSAPFFQENPKLAPAENGGAIVIWTDGRQEATNIYVQKITSDGKTLWEENGKPIAKSTLFKQENPEIINSGGEEWVIVWEDYREGNPTLFAQKINNSGIILWEKTGIQLSTGKNNQEKPNLFKSSSGIIVVWQDKRNGNYDIYGQKISFNGNLLWAEKGVTICNTIGAVVHQNAFPIKSKHLETIVVFEDARSGFTNIYAQKIDASGTLLWGKDGIPVAKVRANQTNPKAIPDGSGGAIVVWEDHRNPNFPKIYAQRISTAGKKLWEKGSSPLTKINSRQSTPLIISDHAGGAIVVWEDERNPLGLKDLYAQRISGNGELLWGENGIAVCAENGEQTDTCIIEDGSGGAFLAWTDYRNGDRNPDIYAQRINSQGNLLWKKEGVVICGAPDVQRSPQIIRDNEGGVIISWTDKGGGSYDIYAQRLNANGQPLWLADGIPITQVGRTQQNSIFATPQILVWEDYRFGNWDIFAGSISPLGKLTWGEEGIAIVSLPQTQYSPTAIPWKNGSAIIAWEDYRTGQQYEIYLQKINNEGKIFWSSNGVLVKSRNGARTPKLLSQPEANSFVVIWEDFTGGGKAIYGQRFITD